MKKLILIIALLTISLYPHSKLLLLFDDGGYDADAQIYFNAMTTPLSSTQKARVNTFVKMLKDSLGITSLSEKFDVMYLLANETSEAGLRNLVKRSHDATAVNSPTFTQWEGFKGNGTSSYINTNYNDSTQAINYKINNASFGIYSRTNIQGNYRDCGENDVSPFSYLGMKWSDGKTYSALTGGGVSFTAPASTACFYLLSRITTDYQNDYVNGSLFQSIPRGTQGLKNLNWAIMQRGGFYSVRQYSFFYIGSGLTDTEVRKLTNCVEYYMDSVGKGVLP